MKKVLAFILALTIICSLCGCAQKNTDTAPATESNDSDTTPATEFDDSDITLEPGTLIIHRTDGEREVTTLSAMLDNIGLNGVVYGQLYVGASIVYVGYVEEINTGNWNFHDIPVGYMMLDEKYDGRVNYSKYAVVEITDIEDCMDIHAGDCVVVTGVIDSFFSDSCAQIYVTDTAKTTITLYEEGSLGEYYYHRSVQ